MTHQENNEILNDLVLKLQNKIQFKITCS